MTDLRVGPVRREHRARVSAILNATGVFSPDEIDVALELFDDAVSTPAARTDSEYELVGAFDARNELTGYACFGATPGTDRTYDLYWIAVDPDAHGAGGGTLLLGEVEARLRTRHGRLLVAETSSRAEYAATHRFYRARGFREAARMRDFYAVGDDRVVYDKRVSQ